MVLHGRGWVMGLIACGMEIRFSQVCFSAAFLYWGTHSAQQSWDSLSSYLLSEWSGPVLKIKKRVLMTLPGRNVCSDFHKTFVRWTSVNYYSSDSRTAPRHRLDRARYCKTGPLARVRFTIKPLKILCFLSAERNNGGRLFRSQRKMQYSKMVSALIYIYFF